MDILKDAKKIYTDSVALYKKSILLHRYSKKVQSHHKRTRKMHPVHHLNLLKVHKEYEDLLKEITNNVNKLKRAIRK
jgi:hypothetical protein